MSSTSSQTGLNMDIDLIAPIDSVIPAASTDLADSAPAMERSDSNDSRKSLSGEDLILHVRRMVNNRARAELIMLDLMEEYNFSFTDFKQLLRDNNLEVSFSRVKYENIAPKVGLDPFKKGFDIPTFPMFRARLSHGLFVKILEDIELFTLQYRPLDEHDTEEARSRLISAYFNRIVGLFSGLLFNTPESLLEGKIASKGRMEYQFKVFDGIIVLFIEVKLEIGSFSERLNCIAQVIAEASACLWMNFRYKFIVPIMAVFCDGKSFTFFKFLNRRQTCRGTSQLFIGQFPDGSREQPIMKMAPGIDPESFLRHCRSLCESFFYIFLSGYHSGLEAEWNRSVEVARKQGQERQSTPGWQNATRLADKALQDAKLARNQWEEGHIKESNQLAESALEHLARSVDEAPQRRPPAKFMNLLLPALANQ